MSNGSSLQDDGMVASTSLSEPEPAARTATESGYLFFDIAYAEIVEPTPPRYDDVYGLRRKYSDEVYFATARIAGERWSGDDSPTTPRMCTLNIPFISSFKNLRELDLSYNSLPNIAGLGDVSWLTELDVSHTLVSDLSPLTGCTRLTSICLSYTSVTRVDVMSYLPLLEDIDIAATGVADLSPLRYLTCIKELCLSNSDVRTLSDMVPEESLKNVEGLYLDGTAITDLTPLRTVAARLSLLSIPEGVTTGLDVLKDVKAIRVYNRGELHYPESTSVGAYLKSMPADICMTRVVSGARFLEFLDAEHKATV